MASTDSQTCQRDEASGKDKTIWMQLDSFPPSPTTPFKHGNVCLSSRLKSLGSVPLPPTRFCTSALVLSSWEQKCSVPRGIVPAVSLAPSVAGGAGSPMGNFFSWALWLSFADFRKAASVQKSRWKSRKLLEMYLLKTFSCTPTD